MKEYKLPIGCDVPETIILADGDFPSHPLALEWLRQCPYVVCCDGAANTYIRSGRMPEAIVGDGDSLLPDIKERYASSPVTGRSEMPYLNHLFPALPHYESTKHIAL